MTGGISEVDICVIWLVRICRSVIIRTEYFLGFTGSRSVSRCNARELKEETNHDHKLGIQKHERSMKCEELSWLMK